MPMLYVKKYSTERIKLDVVKSQQKHGSPIPLSECNRIAEKHSVKAEWVRRVERRPDIDLVAYEKHRAEMKRSGVDADASAGTKVPVGGKGTSRHKKKEIKERLKEQLASLSGVDLDAIRIEFGLPEKSTWPKSILLEVEKEMAGPGKRPVSVAQADMVFDVLGKLGGRFSDKPGEVTRHQAAVAALLDRFSMAQIHKALKSLYYLQKVDRAMRSGFSRKVTRSLLAAINYDMFR